MKQIQEQIKPLIDLYGSIEIRSLNREKGMVFTVYSNTGRTVFTDVDQLPMRKLMQIDSKPGEDIVFRPVLDEQDRVKGVFLNNVPEERLNELPNGTIVVETSPGKYQAHIPLPEPFSKKDADDLQRFLAFYFGSDVGAKDLLHLRHLPGFKNKKYKEQPTVNVVKVVQNDVTIEQLTKEMEKNYKANTEHHKQTREMLKRDDPEIADQIEQILKSDGQEVWERFYAKSNGDKSRADFKYVLRLLRKGYHRDAVAYALYEISPELPLRKQGHVEDYIRRTIDKALKFVT